MLIPKSIFKDGLLDLIKQYDVYIKNANKNNEKPMTLTEYYRMNYSVISIGKKYGRLTVIEKAKPVKSGLRYRARWKCICDCGNEIIVLAQHLPIGHTCSCGCLGREKAAERLRRVAKKHGLSGHPIYKIWCHIRARCNNPNASHYNAYGGRGIKICERWNLFKNFYEDMIETWTEGSSIERIDVNGNYCKENCKWIPVKDQYKNTRKTKWVKINGEELCLKDAVEKHGVVGYTVAQSRITKRGWPVEKALKTETKKISKRWVNINGEKMRLFEAIKKYGKVSYDTIWARINNGWSVERALFSELQR